MSSGFGKTVRKYFRKLHRDIGYLLVGLTLIYGVSGIILNFKQKGNDPAYREITIENNLSSNLSVEEFKIDWNANMGDSPVLTRVLVRGKIYQFYVKGGMGYYQPEDGYVFYQVYQERPLVKFMDDIHYNEGKKYTWLGTSFAIAFLFLAISGLVMVKGKRGFKRWGLYFMLAGILLPVLWYFLV